MRILVVGAGAVGGYFGGRLLAAGRDVTFLVRARRAEEIRTNGLQIISPYGNLTLNPETVITGQIAGPYDLVLLSVKSYGLSTAIEDFAPAIGGATMILPALNGMRHMDVLTARFGTGPVLGGVCRVATEIDDEGRIRQLANFQSLSYGEIEGPITPRIEELHANLSGAGFDTSMSRHIMQDMWEKWVQLAALGAINCLLRGSIGQIAAIPGGAGICLALLDECAGVARACGYPPSEPFFQKLAADFTATGSLMTSSMYRDLTKGAAVEADSIVGDLFHYGQKYGLKTPLLEAAFVNLSIYQKQREPGSPA